MTFWLVMRSMNGEERRFPLDRPRTLIGRETRCDVRIPIPMVEQRHCEILLVDGDLRLTDLGSAVGTFHNGERIQTAILSHEDEVKIGPVIFTVRSQQIKDVDGAVSEVRIMRLTDNNQSDPDGA